MLVADGSCHSDQAITHPLKRKGTARFNIESRDPQAPASNRPIRAVHLSRQTGHAFTGGTHLRCIPQPTGAQESPRADSEQPRPKESQSSELRRLNSVSTDNPKDKVHPSSPWKPLPHLGRPEATPDVEAAQAHTTVR